MSLNYVKTGLIISVIIIIIGYFIYTYNTPPPSSTACSPSNIKGICEAAGQVCSTTGTCVDGKLYPCSASDLYGYCPPNSNTICDNITGSPTLGTCIPNKPCIQPIDCSKCAPFACNKDQTACLTQCGSVSDCVGAGTTCNSTGVCVPYFTCASCNTFACNKAGTACYNTCSSTDQCVPGKICNSGGQCVSPPCGDNPNGCGPGSLCVNNTCTPTPQPQIVILVTDNR